MKTFKDLEALSALIEELRRIPGIPFRNITRIAISLLRRQTAEIDRLCQLLSVAHQKTKPCKICFMLTEQETCYFCQDPTRNKSQICVVASWLEFFIIKEAVSDYRGVFHVLGGVISPLGGVGPADLSINLLLNRIANDGASELLFALSPTPEGEATASYIQSLLPKDAKISIFKIASGVPVGSNLEYADRSTLAQAFTEKKLV